MPAKKSNPKFPNKVQQLVGIANLIRAKFPSVRCDRMTIKDWQTRRIPAFPFADAANRFNTKECFKWVEENIIKKRKGVVQGDEQLELLERKAEHSKFEARIAEAEDAKFELEKKKGLYVERKIAEQVRDEALRIYHSRVKIEVENYNPVLRREKLLALGIVPEIVAKFHLFDIEQSKLTIDRIEKWCEQNPEGEE